MKQLNIALGLIEQNDAYFLQLRGLDPQIGAAGLIGCFGGKIEEDKNETAQQAAKREIAEETNLDPDLDDLERLGKVEVESDYKGGLVRIRADVFHIMVDPSFVIEAREGSLVALKLHEIPTKLSEMTPGTRACFEEFIL